MFHFSRDSSLLTRRDFLGRTAAGLVAPISFLPGIAQAVPAPPKPPTGLLAFDNCDPNYKGKDRYEDNLSFFDSTGKLVWRVTGLNNCEEIGSPHKIGIDLVRRRLWVTENVGNRLLQYDLAGRELAAIRDIKASALAIEPATGNVWVLRSTGGIGQGSTEVFDHDGQSVATYDHHGWDIAYDGKSKAFWMADRNLLKVSAKGEPLVHKEITKWCASSLAVDQKTGMVWVATREHSPNLGKDELLCFDNDGKLIKTIPLGAPAPFRVAVDSRRGLVWVACFRGPVFRYTADGKLEGTLKQSAIAVEVEAQTGNGWVVTQEEVLKVNPKGEVLARAKHKSKTSQAWIAAF